MLSRSQVLQRMLLVMAVLTFVVVPIARAGGSITPDVVRQWFDAGAIAIMFAWGFACKYVPWLKAIPNMLIAWVNLAGYILTHLAGGATAALLGVGTAYAAGGVVSVLPGLISALLPAFTNAVWARQLYEGFGRGIFEGWLHLDRQPHIVETRRAALAAQ